MDHTRLQCRPVDDVGNDFRFDSDGALCAVRRGFYCMHCGIQGSLDCRHNSIDRLVFKGGISGRYHQTIKRRNGTAPEYGFDIEIDFRNGLHENFSIGYGVASFIGPDSGQIRGAYNVEGDEIGNRIMGGKSRADTGFTPFASPSSPSPPCYAMTTFAIWVGAEKSVGYVAMGGLISKNYFPVRTKRPH